MKPNIPALTTPSMVGDASAKAFTVQQDATLTYDALGRLTQYRDLGTLIRYAYDEAGNRRHCGAQ